LRSQPVDAAASIQPRVDLGFALEALDLARFKIRAGGDDLPVVLGNPLHFESDSGRFCHAGIMPVFGAVR